MKKAGGGDVKRWEKNDSSADKWTAAVVYSLMAIL